MPSNDFLSPATEFRVGFCTCNFTAFKQKEKRTEGEKNSVLVKADGIKMQAVNKSFIVA